MFASHWRRYIHSGFSSLSAVNKSLLGKLRKKTGYTLSNCKNALKMHNNDLQEAETWLHEQAQAQGWEKAFKVQDRLTSQGLVGLMVKNGNAAMVEVNCETDFVARNKAFQALVHKAVQHCFEFTEKQTLMDPLQKEYLSREQLNELPASENKTLADIVALSIGQLGENMCLRQALCVKAEEGLLLSGCVHPPISSDVSKFGKFASIVAFRSMLSEKEEAENELTLQEFGRQLCQHIIGMNPRIIGGPDDEPASNPEEETVLIHQEFLLDNSVTVGEILQEMKVTIVDFMRLECGEQKTKE